MTYEKNEKIKKYLLRIGAISAEKITLFSDKTRDKSDVKVLRDAGSSVIFIDDYYVGDAEYNSGRYRPSGNVPESKASLGYEDALDNERRYQMLRSMLFSKDILDFGCGAGSFLRIAEAEARSVTGVELQENYVFSLRNNGIDCFKSIAETEDRTFDVMTMFHCLEHLPNPAETLRALYGRLKPEGQGVIVVEVPHARDFLISQLAVKEFIDFTLWSQHLVLHTRESLRLALADAGFQNITVKAVQRYNLSNHLHWLARKRPGGHKTPLSILQTKELTAAYSASLANIDASDTLVAIATT